MYAPITKGLRDRNSPTCTLSQNGYGVNIFARLGVRAGGLRAAGGITAGERVHMQAGRRAGGGVAAVW